MDKMTDTDIIKIDTNPFKNETIQTLVETFPLVNETHPALKKVLPTFDFGNPAVNPNKFASSLVETCKKYNGLGLSANQCGYEHRVFVMGSGENFVAFFNPEIVWKSEETIRMEEGCLSFTDLFISIERPISIKVKYQDFTGETKEAMFAGLTARCFQHELDHLNGIVYTHVAKPLALQMATKKRKKLADKRQKLRKQLMNKAKNVSKQLAGLHQ